MGREHWRGAMANELVKVGNVVPLVTTRVLTPPVMNLAIAALLSGRSFANIWARSNSQENRARSNRDRKH